MGLIATQVLIFPLVATFFNLTNKKDKNEGCQDNVSIVLRCCRV